MAKAHPSVERIPRLQYNRVLPGGLDDLKRHHFSLKRRVKNRRAKRQTALFGSHACPSRYDSLTEVAAPEPTDAGNPGSLTTLSGHHLSARVYRAQFYVKRKAEELREVAVEHLAGGRERQVLGLLGGEDRCDGAAEEVATCARWLRLCAASPVRTDRGAAPRGAENTLSRLFATAGSTT
jgi:hypothetical protein